MDDELEAVTQTARRLRSADKARDKARDDHIDAVLVALRAGQPPTEIADRSPLTAARLRQIAREAGIPPATKGRRSAE
jgi:hypothetical protein